MTKDRLSTVRIARRFVTKFRHIAIIAIRCYRIDRVAKGQRMHDVVIIGGGHNGLVCSAYLAIAGLSVVVLEQRHIVGGAAVTEEFSPGFSNSVAAYTVSLLHPRIIRDLELYAYGLRIVERPIANFLPLDDGRFLKVGGDQTKREIAKFSARDAARLDDYQTRLVAIFNVLRSVAWKRHLMPSRARPWRRSPN
ncbi:MAG: NAD(P)-binding protein [Rhodoplanes sp.]